MCKTMATCDQILSVLKNGRSRRSLFGPVDSEQLQVEYQTALQKDLEEASKRWGFDFLLDKPLAGSDFQWEGIPGTKVPLLNRSCVFDVGKEEGQSVTKVNSKRGRVERLQSDKENIPGTTERCALSLKNLEETSARGENAAAKRKQTNITDFYQAKRRVVWMPRKSGE